MPCESRDTRVSASGTLDDDQHHRPCSQDTATYHHAQANSFVWSTGPVPVPATRCDDGHCYALHAGLGDVGAVHADTGRCIATLINSSRPISSAALAYGHRQMPRARHLASAIIAHQSPSVHLHHHKHKQATGVQVTAGETRLTGALRLLCAYPSQWLPRCSACSSFWRRLRASQSISGLAKLR